MNDNCMTMNDNCMTMNDNELLNTKFQNKNNEL